MFVGRYIKRRAGWKRAELLKLSLRTGTALNGALAAAFLFSPAPARADDECGRAVNGVVTCRPAGNPYSDGIYYSTKENLTLKVEDGVVVAPEPGRVRVDGEGDADVTIHVAAGASIGGSGFVRSGVEGNAINGDVFIDARGPIKTKGFLAFGIRGKSNGGAVTIQSGDIRSEGGNGISVSGSAQPISINATGYIHSVEGIDLLGPGRQVVSGIFVVGGGEVQIANSGLVEVDSSPEFIPGTSGLAANGIHAETAGDVTISGAGAINTSGFQSRGILAGGDNIRIEQDSVVTTGSEATGIVAAAENNIAIDVGMVSSARYRGIVAISNAGDVSVDFGSVNAVGNGIDAQSGTGSVRVTGGPVTATGQASAAILVLAGADGTVAVNDAVKASRGFGVVIENRGAARLDIDAAGSIAGGIDAVHIVTGPDGATINNAGTITGGSDFALFVDGGPVTIDNAGTVSGRVQLSGSDGLLSNSGIFDATADSDFGTGSDRFVNGGALNILPGGGSPGEVEFVGLEKFENGGTVNLANGRAGDLLKLDGDYTGLDGRLQLDVDMTGTNGKADQLIVGGVATGSTHIVLNGLSDRLPDAATLIAHGGEGSSADAFTADGVNVGFIEYGISFDPASGDYSLVGGPGEAAYRTPKYLEGAQNLWYLSSDAWSAHLRGGRDGRRKDAFGRLWTQAYGSIDSRRGVSETSFAGVTVSSGSSYDQDYFGGQAGYDFMRLGGNSGMFTAGITGGYIGSNLDFRGTSSEASYDAINAGVSAAFSRGILFANVLGKYDHYWIDASDTSIGLDEKIDGDAFGVTAEIGLRAGSDSLFFEPAAALSYVRTTLDDFSALSSDFDFATAEGLRGRLGARAGTTFDTSEGTRIAFYIGGNAVKEFEGRDGVTFRNNGQEIAIDNDRIGLYGEGIVGLDVSNGRLSGFLEGFGKFGSSDDVRGGGGRAGISLDF